MHLLDLLKCYEAIFLKHRNNSVIIHFSLLLWSFWPFGVAVLKNLIIIF